MLRMDWDDDDWILGPLSLVDGNGIRQYNFVQIGKIIVHLPTIKGKEPFTIVVHSRYLDLSDRSKSPSSKISRLCPLRGVWYFEG